MFSCSVVSLCNPMDCSLPGSSLHGDFPGKILERAAMPSSRKSSQPRDRTQVSHNAGRFFAVWATWQALCQVSLQKQKKKKSPKEFNSSPITFIHFGQTPEMSSLYRRARGLLPTPWPLELAFVILHLIAIHILLPLRTWTCWGMDFVLCLGTLCPSLSFIKTWSFR